MGLRLHQGADPDGAAHLIRSSLVPTGAILLAAAILAPAWTQPSSRATEFSPAAEFHFLRLEYRDRPGLRRPWGRGWWMQDWPEADAHFAQGLRRLTRLDVGSNEHVPLTDDRIFEYPWTYATQVGYWDLSPTEIARLREYLRRGGFLVTDDFWGERDWAAFEASMRAVLPGEPILDIAEDAAVMHVLFDIEDRTLIPGLRHLRRAPGGGISVEPQAVPPRWRSMNDEKGRMVVAINYNQDVGDAWEHADMPEYPAEMTALAYRFGVNYIVYAMTH